MSRFTAEMNQAGPRGVEKKKGGLYGTRANYATLARAGAHVRHHARQMANSCLQIASISAPCRDLRLQFPLSTSDEKKEFARREEGSEGGPETRRRPNKGGLLCVENARACRHRAQSGKVLLTPRRT